MKTLKFTLTAEAASSQQRMVIPAELPQRVESGIGAGGVERAESLPNIVSFSGGQTSGYMLRRLMDKHADFGTRFQVVFENTGKEHDATLDFVHDVETKWGVPVTWLEYCRIPALDIDPLLVEEGQKRSNLLKQQEAGEMAHWWRQVRWETAARYNDTVTPFDELLEWANVLPNVQSRMCSVQLKVRTRDRYLWATGVRSFNAYIGVRKDEEHRKHEILANVGKHENPQFPLCDDGVMKADVDGWWDAQPFRLNIDNIDGNCRLCYLKARWKRVAIARRDPTAALWWVDKEDVFAKKTTGDGRYFRKGQSYQGVLNDAMHPELPFPDADDEDVPCSCAVGGYRHANDEESEIGPLGGGGRGVSLTANGTKDRGYNEKLRDDDERAAGGN